MIETASTRLIEVSNQYQSGIADPEQWLIDALGGGTTSSSGVTMNYYTALSLPVVWRSLSLIGGHFGQLPFQVRRKTANGSEEIPQHPTRRAMDTPNDLQTEHVFRETMIGHALLAGNGRAVIVRNGVGQPIEFLLMWPESSYTQMIDGEKYHFTTFDPRYISPDRPLPVAEPSGTGPAALYRFHDSDVLHLPALSYNGLWGLTVYHVLRDALGLGRAGMDQAGSAFRNNGKPGLIIEVPNHQLRTQKEMNEFRKVWAEAHSGVLNANKTAFLRDGMKLHQINGSAVDSQFAEQRKISDEQIAMIFGTQGMIGEGKAVYKDLAQRMASYVQNTLSPWLCKFEEECDRKLLSERERLAGGIYHKFDVGKLLRGDPNSLADYTGKLTNQKALSPNDVREMHNLNRVPGLDEYPTETPDEPDPILSPMAPREQQDDSEAENRALRLHFANVFNAEKQSLLRAAKNNPDFLEWLLPYYQRRREQLYDLCERLGRPLHGADDYIQCRITEMQSLASVCNDGEELADAIESHLSEHNIEGRINAITQAV